MQNRTKKISKTFLFNFLYWARLASKLAKYANTTKKKFSQVLKSTLYSLQTLKRKEERKAQKIGEKQSLINESDINVLRL